MEDIAQRIVEFLEPAEGWWKPDAEERLIEVALTMLEDMDEDSVEECMNIVFTVAQAEYGE